MDRGLSDWLLSSSAPGCCLAGTAPSWLQRDPAARISSCGLSPLMHRQPGDYMESEVTCPGRLIYLVCLACTYLLRQRRFRLKSMTLDLVLVNQA